MFEIVDNYRKQYFQTMIIVIFIITFLLSAASIIKLKDYDLHIPFWGSILISVIIVIISVDYKNFRNAVEHIQSLGNELNLKTAEGKQLAAKQIINLNASLLSAATKYMKGKEAVRGSIEGKLRFDNALDALSLMSKYAPQTKDQIELTIEHINKIRKVNETHKYHVKLSDYDERRAKKALKDANSKNEAQKKAVNIKRLINNNSPAL